MSERHWGGARPNAGRKPLVEHSTRVLITLPQSLREKLRRLGGSKWVIEKLREAEEKA